MIKLIDLLNILSIRFHAIIFKGAKVIASGSIDELRFTIIDENLMVTLISPFDEEFINISVR